MKLYHVAIGKHVLVRKFVPRVPESVHPREDIITPRICFAETIEGVFIGDRADVLLPRNSRTANCVGRRF